MRVECSAGVWEPHGLCIDSAWGAKVVLGWGEGGGPVWGGSRLGEGLH